MKSIDTWLEEYGESHQNSINKVIHWICVPLIFFSILGLFYSVSLHFVILNIPLTAAHVVLFLLLIYYLILSPSLATGMAFFGLICLTLCNFLYTIGFPLWVISIAIFIVAWVGQFIGHHIEGKKLSFLKDIQFLLIGPAWLMAQLYRKMGIGI